MCAGTGSPGFPSGSSNAATAGHEHTRLRSPWAPSTRRTGGHTLRSCTPGVAPVDPAAQRIDLTTVVDFDPPPGDGAERPGTVPGAVDDDPATAWETERYDSAALGGLKAGVGLLVDLGAPTQVDRVELLDLEPTGSTGFTVR